MERISKEDMVLLANQRLRPHLESVPGLVIVDAETMGSTLVLRGECFLRDDGAPTERTIDAIRIYRVIAEELAREYEVIPA